jgi:DNA-binding transcriptional regulator YiaG
MSKQAVWISSRKATFHENRQHRILGPGDRFTPTREWIAATWAKEGQEWMWDASAKVEESGVVAEAAVSAVPPPPALTGREIKAWRESKGLSQARAAQLFGVSGNQLARAEQQPSKPVQSTIRDQCLRVIEEDRRGSADVRGDDRSDRGGAGAPDNVLGVDSPARGNGDDDPQRGGG